MLVKIDHFSNLTFETCAPHWRIAQEPQELQRFNYAYEFIDKSAVIKHHQVLSKVRSICVLTSYEQLPTLPPL